MQAIYFGFKRAYVRCKLLCDFLRELVNPLLGPVHQKVDIYPLANYLLEFPKDCLGSVDGSNLAPPDVH